MKSITTFSMGHNEPILETLYISGSNYGRIQSIANQYAQKMGYKFSYSKYVDSYGFKYPLLTQFGNKFKKIRA